MGKNDFLTPKAIANRIKAKGLNKLRWYCQLCQKSCRDENGFKCHQTSEGHRRQMELFGMNANRVVEGYSEEFESNFLEHLRRSHPQARVSAKTVYNEFIADRNHVHMNSTKWLTLTDFVKYLGREGKCKVEETPKGWFITLIQEDPMKKLGDERRIKRALHEEEEEVRAARLMAEQVERARKQARTDAGPVEGSALERDEEAAAQAPLKLSLLPGAVEGDGAAAAVGGAVLAGGSGRPALARPAPVFGDEEEEEDDAGPSTSAAAAKGQQGRKLTKMDEIMQRDLQEKARRAAAEAAAAATAAGPSSSGGGKGRLDHWLAPGIVVKVMSKALKEHGYYKQKGVVERVIDRYVGELAMLDGGDVVRVDQAELETVIPAVGGRVLVVNGPHRGAKGTLADIDTGRYQARVKLAKGGEELWMDYEDICKLAST